MLGGKFILTQFSVLCSSKQESWSETEEFRITWQAVLLACILVPWELQKAPNFYITQHMEVIFMVSLMRHLKQHVSLFTRRSFNRCSLRKKQSIIMMDPWMK